MYIFIYTYLYTYYDFKWEQYQMYFYAKDGISTVHLHWKF